ncbi:MAG: hypothetical protein HQM10_15005 [Candidatus Riflebacteria bacterium]|nr:hypothetical protein [Candidatus Riflebacteria bacterium]
MKSRVLLVVLLMVLVGAASAYAYYDYRDLQRAHYMRDRGDFYGARNLYDRISYDYSTSYDIQREASYYTGFCDVRMNNPWRAIDAFRNFLSRFDIGGNIRFVPDALYVLGRTYEDVGDRYQAKYYYRQCVDRFRYGEFPEKSRERLRYLGDYYPGPYYSIQTMATDNVPAVVKSEKSASDPFVGFSLDQVRVSRVNKLIEAVNKLQGVEEALSGLTSNDNELEVVKDSMKLYQEKQKFENLHEIK